MDIGLLTKVVIAVDRLNERYGEGMIATGTAKEFNLLCLPLMNVIHIQLGEDTLWESEEEPADETIEGIIMGCEEELKCLADMYAVFK